MMLIIQQLFYTVILLIYYLPPTNCTIYYTHNDGKGGYRDGSYGKPFETITECVKRLKRPGDECQIRTGTYREKIDVSGLKGTPNTHIKIQGYGDDRPVLDGTVDLIPPGGKWTERSDGVWYGRISHKIWQLFLGELMMTNARWPNAKWSDKSIFDGKNHWAKIGKKTKIGNIVNRDKSLAATGLNMTGAIAILNTGSWCTFVAKVDAHTPKENSFSYTDTFGTYSSNWRVSQYYLEDKYELLDAEEEWFFDKDSMMLYFIPPGGKGFTETTKLRGKVQTYAMTLSDSQYVDIKNIDFFGTTILGNSGLKRKSPFIDHIRFDSLNFKFPSASKRMLGKTDLTEGMVINGKRNVGSMTSWKTFEFFNNTFHGADGIALKYSGAYVKVENNLFTYNDWTSANMKKFGKGAATILPKSIHDTISRNTLLNNGEGHGIKPGEEANVKLNHVVKQCWGTQQNDGAGIQVTVNQQKNCHITDNWVHDSPKYGIRFDGVPPRTGSHGTLERNVGFRLGNGGFQMKGDYQKMRHSLAFDAEDGNPRSLPGCSLCSFRYLRHLTKYEMNKHSTLDSNMADVAHGCKKFDSNGKLIVPMQYWPLQSSKIINNVIDHNIKAMMYDPDNNDFRVLPGTPAAAAGAGPYPYQAGRVSEYWIPGRQLYKASSPVPPSISRKEYKNEKKRVNVKHRDAVMWLNAYGCKSHLVYFGTSETSVEAATPKSGEYLGYTLREGNVMYLAPGTIAADTTYYWRVDAYCLKEVNGQKKFAVYKGDVWEFTTEV